MKAFIIDPDNNISAFASLAETDQTRGATEERFTDEAALGKLAQAWSAARLIEIWNSLPGVVPVQRFTSRATAVRRIWKAIQHLQPTGGARVRTVASKKVGGRKTATKPLRAAPPQNKTTQVIALLREAKGATLQQIMAATGWQNHSVRGFISGQLKKKLGLKVRSFKRNGERVYALKG